MIEKFDSDSRKNWRKAFWIVLRGPPSVISVWKQSVLTLAIVGTFFCPIFTYYVARPYQGVIPSDASLVTSRGRVIFNVETNGLKHARIANFLPDGGQPLHIQDYFTSLYEMKKWTNEHPFESLYVKGFSLCDGAGSFWITYVATASGQVLVNEDKRKITLHKSRERFGTVFWWMYGYLVIPLWLISIYNIRKVRNSLGNGIE